MEPYLKKRWRRARHRPTGWGNIITIVLLIIAVVCILPDPDKNNYSTVDQLRHDLLQLEKEVDRKLLNSEWKDNEGYLQLIKIYKDFGNEIENRFPTTGHENLNALNSVWLWARTQETLNEIEGLYKVFRQMQYETIDHNAPMDLNKLVNFAENILRDPNASIPRALARVADFIVQDKLFISAYQEASSQICYEYQSPQQLLYNLYITVALAEIKGYTMIQFSYTLLRMYNPGSTFAEETELIKQQYATRTSETLRAVKTAMAFAPRDLWKCDARIPKLDETYTEMKQLLQGYIVNEVDLNSESTCRNNCGYYEYAKVYGCYQNQYCASQRKCNGKVINCEYIDSDMWICPSKTNDRRYEYIQYEDGRTFGQNGVCKAGTTKVDSWWRWLFWHCSYCFCYCDDHNASSHRYFSLRQVVADIAKHKVITGVRLTKAKKIIHLQIQEGELLPRGAINRTTVTWKPVDEFSILDSNVKNGVDYHTLAWEKRAVDLDDLVAPEEHLLTGVRFRVVGTRINLEIMVTPFDFTTGKLIQPLEKSFWHSNDITDRTELKLKNPDIPIRSLIPNMPDSGLNQYVNFAASDREKDAAQSTIPFIDIQQVESRPPVPMSGAGIFHKGATGSGGFIAMKLITYNYAPHLQVDLPPSPPVIKS